MAEVGTKQYWLEKAQDAQDQIDLTNNATTKAYWQEQYDIATLNASNADDDTTSSVSTGGGTAGETYSMSIHYNNSRKTFSGTSGDDSIINYGDYITLDAGAGNDIVVNAGEGYDVIYGGAGNDSIKNAAYFSTLFGGAGNDTLLGFEDDTAMFIYNSGDGNDVIQGFDSSDTLSISGDNYSTTKSGSDIVVTVGNGKITLVGAGGISPNIAGTYGSSTVQAATPATVAPATVAPATVATETVASYLPVTPAVSYVYAGGDQVISDYQSGEQIILGTMPTSWIFGDGNFALGSATGNLFITNANDKVIDFVDGAGNSFLKAYAATNAGIIDGRGLAGYEYIVGSDAGTDIIFAGDGGSQLWGGNGVDSDVLVGGGGADMFIGGKYQGSDTFMNTGTADMLFLNDAILSDLVFAGETDSGTVALAFNTGNVIAVQSSEALSAAVVLADGSAYRFNHATKSWQGA